MDGKKRCVPGRARAGPRLNLKSVCRGVGVGAMPTKQADEAGAGEWQHIRDNDFVTMGCA